jgi:hypothetical protein
MTDKQIQDGGIDLIYASPETLVGDPAWRASLTKLNHMKSIIFSRWLSNATKKMKETDYHH